MLFTRKHATSYHPLMLKDIQLNYVDQYKYILASFFGPSFSWSNHIGLIVNKVRRLTGLLYRRFYKHSNSQTLLRLYGSFICPHLEYASVVWSPHLTNEKKKKKLSTLLLRFA